MFLSYVFVRERFVPRHQGSIGILSEAPTDSPYSDPGIVSGSSEWAYSTPVIETGSILMARPGDTFAQRQQYFHKSVVLIIKHDDAGDMGLSAARLFLCCSILFCVFFGKWNRWSVTVCSTVGGNLGTSSIRNQVSSSIVPAASTRGSWASKVHRGTFGLVATVRESVTPMSGAFEVSAFM